MLYPNITPIVWIVVFVILSILNTLFIINDRRRYLNYIGLIICLVSIYFLL